MHLPILHQDPHFIAINKPCGLLVHRTRIAEEQTHFALQLLRNQIGQRVYPIHRLDRPTSGVLIFGLNKEAASSFQEQIKAHTIQKKYWTIVRGYTEEKGVIEYDLKKDGDGVLQKAITHYQRLATTELNIPVSRYPTARYSLVEVYPQTGRMHQIRRHFAHLRHYIVGDKTHGERHHNRMFKEQLNCPLMLLHAHSLTFKHPFSQQQTEIKAPLPEHWKNVLPYLNLEKFAESLD